jgi:hypothetical protein
MNETLIVSSRTQMTSSLHNLGLKPLKNPPSMHSLPFIWNNLAPEPKLQQNVITFKWALKVHLFEYIIEQKFLFGSSSSCYKVLTLFSYV